MTSSSRRLAHRQHRHHRFAHVAAFADYFERLVIPHVLGSATTALHLAATLPPMAAASNCPWVEYPCDPPVLTPATLQALICEPILVEADGCVTLPDKPGLGIELNEDWLADKVAVNQTVKL
jgi:L-alanine-DL-glutamate epimerase-like enolase superfamily enzyme